MSRIRMIAPAPPAMPSPWISLTAMVTISMIAEKKMARTASAETRPMMIDQREAGVSRSLSK